MALTESTMCCRARTMARVAMNVGAFVKYKLTFAHFIFHPCATGFLKEFGCKFGISWEVGHIYFINGGYLLGRFPVPKPPVNFQSRTGNHPPWRSACRTPTIPVNFSVAAEFQIRTEFCCNTSKPIQTVGPRVHVEIQSHGKHVSSFYRELLWLRHS